MKMDQFNLTSEQRQTVRDFVNAAEKTETSRFFFMTTYGCTAIFRTKNGGDPSMVETNFEDLEVIESEDLIRLRRKVSGYRLRGTAELRQGNGEYLGGSVRQSAINAVAADFTKFATSPNYLPMTHNFHGPVGAVHTGSGNILVAAQTFGLDPKQLVELLNDLRTSFASLSPEARSEAEEYLSDVETELARRDAPPKKSRIKSSILALWSGTRQVAEVADRAVKLAGALGIDTTIFS